MRERGAEPAEVIAAIREGQSQPVRGGRTMYRKNFQFEAEWRGRRYRLKQVAPIVALDPETLFAVAVFVFCSRAWRHTP